jgi:hypothetical protein
MDKRLVPEKYLLRLLPKENTIKNRKNPNNNNSITRIIQYNP